MTSRLNHTLGVCLSASLVLGGCGSSSNGGFGLNSGAGAAEISKAGLASAYLSGRTALQSGSVDIAAEQFHLALQADPENQELRQQLFALYLADGQFDLALTVANDLKELDTQFDDAVLFLAFDSFKPQFSGFPPGATPPEPGASGIEASDLAINFHAMLGWSF